MGRHKLTDQAAIMSWQEHVEGLVVGAMRGMAEAQAAMDTATNGALPPLNDMTMFEATELLAATLLEASAVCDDPRAMTNASRKVGRDILTYMRGLRAQRGDDGTPALLEIMREAGLERHRAH